MKQNKQKGASYYHQGDSQMYDTQEMGNMYSNQNQHQLHHQQQNLAHYSKKQFKNIGDEQTYWSSGKKNSYYGSNSGGYYYTGYDYPGEYQNATSGYTYGRNSDYQYIQQEQYHRDDFEVQQYYGSSPLKKKTKKSLQSNQFNVMDQTYEQSQDLVDNDYYNTPHKKRKNPLKKKEKTKQNSIDATIVNSQQQQQEKHVVRRNYICYVCKTDLKTCEKEFYPCNCKYQICYKCYYIQVKEKERKCPNCGKHYEVNRVEEYKQSKMQTETQPEQNQKFQKKIREVVDKEIPQQSDQIHHLTKMHSSPQKKAVHKPVMTKIKTDEDIIVKNGEKLIKDIVGEAPTVQQKYDLVSKNQEEDDALDIEQNLQNYCKFPQGNDPEPEDSECIDLVSMRSSQTQNIMKHNQIQNQNLRRTNSQENRIAPSQVLNQGSSQSGFSVPGQISSGLVNTQSIYSGVKGIKHSKIRIIQKTTVYVINLSPSLADETVMKRYEYFGQYGVIQNITINKDTHTTFLKDDVESTSSNKSQISYAAYITYTSPQDASLAIMALDQHIYDGRLIRASYGRTKYCKFFLKNHSCPKKDCPYKHKESKEEDILTLDDMQKKALFQYCLQLALQISKITDMTETQFRNLLKHKRERLSHQNNSKHVLPKVESIFENKDLMRQVNRIKQMPDMIKNSSIGGQNYEVASSDKQKLQRREMKTQASALLKTRRAPNNTMGSQQQIQTLQSTALKTIYKPKTLKLTEESALTTKKLHRSGSHRQAEREESKRKLLEPERGGERTSITPRRHSYSRMLSQSRKEIQIQDIKKVQLTNVVKMPQKEKEVSKHRKKSVSKSIQRQNSMSSLVDYTLKFLNDDMAINQTTIQAEPLIEKSVEDDQQSQINRMLFNQEENKSSYFSVGDGQQTDLKKINSIYTSPFFLINSQDNKKDSVYQIWEKFDSIDNILALKQDNYSQPLVSLYQQNSCQKMKVDSRPFLKTKSTKTLEQMDKQIRGPSKLNEKNLYLFNKQQDELYDKQQYWNKIFLPKTESGREDIITSQSVFCFPMGIQDEKQDYQLRNSVVMPNIAQRQTPKKQNTETLEIIGTVGNTWTSSSMNAKLKNLSNPGSSLQQKQIPFRISREINTADEQYNVNDFDRRSAGERFAFQQTSAYHEFMKVNNIFNGKFKRRNSCSQSQSHSRVRMHPSIYHEEVSPFEECKSPPLQKENLI